MNYDPRDPKNLGFYLTYIASEGRAPKLPRPGRLALLGLFLILCIAVSMVR